MSIAAALTAHALNIGYVPVITEGVPALTRGRISHVDPASRRPEQRGTPAREELAGGQTGPDYDVLIDGELKAARPNLGEASEMTTSDNHSGPVPSSRRNSVEVVADLRARHAEYKASLEIPMAAARQAYVAEHKAVNHALDLQFEKHFPLSQVAQALGVSAPRVQKLGTTEPPASGDLAGTLARARPLVRRNPPGSVLPALDADAHSSVLAVRAARLHLLDAATDFVEAHARAREPIIVAARDAHQGGVDLRDLAEALDTDLKSLKSLEVLLYPNLAPRPSRTPEKPAEDLKPQRTRSQLRHGPQEPLF